MGSERQLFLDEFWFDSREGIRLTPHRPQPREVSLTCVEPWEGKELHYSSVVQDRGLYRMWYRVAEKEPPFPVWTCYAESRDGITWERRNLGVFSRKGSTRNNIIGDPKDFTNVSVIVDPNQQPGSSSRYKMISRVGGISGFISADGIRWQPVRTNPLLPPEKGPFDSHNILVWDDERRRFVIYLRGVDPSVEGSFKGGAPGYPADRIDRFSPLVRTGTGTRAGRTGPEGPPLLHQRRRQVLSGGPGLPHVSHGSISRPEASRRCAP